jgi:hypothetical protein
MDVARDAREAPKAAVESSKHEALSIGYFELGATASYFVLRATCVNCWSGYWIVAFSRSSSALINASKSGRDSGTSFSATHAAMYRL